MFFFFNKVTVIAAQDFTFLLPLLFIFQLGYALLELFVILLRFLSLLLFRSVFVSQLLHLLFSCRLFATNSFGALLRIGIKQQRTPLK